MRTRYLKKTADALSNAEKNSAAANNTGQLLLEKSDAMDEKLGVLTRLNVGANE